MSNFLCELCCPNGEDLGEFIPGFHLIKIKDSQAYIVVSIQSQGHFQLNNLEDFIYLWNIKPELEVIDNDIEYGIQFDRIEPYIIDKSFTPIEGYILVTSCIKVGYDPYKNGGIQWWLFFKAAEYLNSFNDEIYLY